MCRCWRDSDNWAINIEIKDEGAERQVGYAVNK